jgi:thiamine-monophosphate kinase
MIDVSDGLLADLGHICETSGTAAVIEMARLPLSPAARAVAESSRDILPRLAAAGDDYELLFAAPAGATETIVVLSSVLQIPITEIGRIEAGAGVRLVDDDGRTIPVEATGYRHF